MKPLYARSLTQEEREALQQGLKSSNGFTVRRAQMLLMSADEGLKVDEIGERVGCRGQAVREAIHAFHEAGLACLARKSRARQDDQRAFGDAARERLQELIRLSPRVLGYETSLWTLDLLAQASYAEGLTTHQVHPDTISETLHSMGIRWQRAKKQINSPDTRYAGKKTPRLVERSGASTAGLGVV
jgi:transposase